VSLMDRGLDLAHLDEITDEELEAFNLHYSTWDGRPHVGLNMWVEQGRPDYLKRYRLFARYLATAPTDTAVTPDNVGTNLSSANKAASAPFSTVYYYGLLGFEAGIRYPLHGAQVTGFSKDDCLQGIAIACMYSGARGMETVADALRDYTWLEPAEPPRFENGWRRDEATLFAGLDYSSPDLSKAELSALEQWYGDTLGEVPAYVRFLGRHNPRLLKAYRNRWEHLLTTLPNQVLPTTLLQIHLLRQDRAGIRENALLAKAWGVTYPEIIHSLCAWMVFGGPEMATLAQETVGDLIDHWD
jgi:hypothetical protein